MKTFRNKRKQKNKTEKRNKTMKHVKSIKKQIGGNKQTTIQFIKTTMEFLTSIKMYHWTTKSYPAHKTTDKLYAKLQDLMDTFVETSLGHYEHKQMLQHKIKTINVTPIINNKSLEKYTNHYKKELKNIRNKISDKSASEIINVIDDILTELDVFLYLLTFGNK